MDELTTECNLICKLRGSFVRLGLFSLDVSHGCLYNGALVDVRSTGAGIKCLYCNFRAGHAVYSIVFCHHCCNYVIDRLPVSDMLQC